MLLWLMKLALKIPRMKFLKRIMRLLINWNQQKKPKQLTTSQQAIEIQSKELEDLHEIKLNADSLAALLYSQKEKTTSFYKDMRERSLAFDQNMTQKRALKNRMNLSCLVKTMSSKQKNPVNAKKMNILINAIWRVNKERDPCCSTEQPVEQQ